MVDVVGRGEHPGPPGVDIGDRVDLDAGNAPQRADMVAGDLAAADDSYPHERLPKSTAQTRSAKASRKPRMAIS